MHLFAQHWGKGRQDALMLHCSLASSEAWSGVAKRLTEQLTMTAVDLPGHGKSPDWDGTGDYHQICTGAVWQDLPDALRQSLIRRINLIPATEGALIDDNAGVGMPGRIEQIACPVLLIEGHRDRCRSVDPHQP